MLVWWEKIVSNFWSVSLFLWVIVLELLVFYPFHIPNMAVVRPCLALVAVYYFALYAPRYFSIGMAFIAGIFADMLFMVPMGTYTLVFLVLYVMTDILRKSLLDKPFFVLWVAFSLFGFVVNMLAWLIVATVAGRFTAIMPMMVSYLLLVALYPFVVMPCYLALKLLIRAKRYE